LKQLRKRSGDGERVKKKGRKEKRGARKGGTACLARGKEQCR
jgi:hypothetical protein